MYAGASIRDITSPIGVQLAGYPHVRRLASGTHDPLLASALFLSTGSSNVFLCSLDLLMVNTPVARQMRRRVSHALHIPECCVLISCTHTHSGPVSLDYLPWRGDPAMPVPDPNYLLQVETRVIEAALEAKATAAPAILKWTTADAQDIGGNRHSPVGPTDSEAGVLAVYSQNELRAVLVVYGMHPTVLHEDSTLFSSDFPHYTRQHIRDAFGGQTTVLYHTGPCGNLSPRYFVTGQTFAEAARLGGLLGERIVSAIVDSADPPPIAETLAGDICRVRLPRRFWPSPDEAEGYLAFARDHFEKLRAQNADRRLLRTAEVAVFGAESAYSLVRANQSGIIQQTLDSFEPIEVQALRINDACIVGLPGEIFVEYSLRLKKQSSRKVFPIAYANGELQGYIVTPEAAAAGGYEAASRLFEPAAGDILVDSALSLIDRIWP